MAEEKSMVRTRLTPNIKRENKGIAESLSLGLLPL